MATDDSKNDTNTTLSIGKWLESLGLGSLAKQFQDNGIKSVQDIRGCPTKQSFVNLIRKAGINHEKNEMEFNKLFKGYEHLLTNEIGKGAPIVAFHAFPFGVYGETAPAEVNTLEYFVEQAAKGNHFGFFYHSAYRMGAVIKSVTSVVPSKDSWAVYYIVTDGNQ
eukprot:65172_1